MATRFGDLFDRVQKLCALLQTLLHARKAVFMAAVRGRPLGLPVFRSRFANLRTAVTHSFGDD
jgi:ABC-type nitrate/sulfonate/bicarbonate transport system permease component